jgi:hypothetical protein
MTSSSSFGISQITLQLQLNREIDAGTNTCGAGGLYPSDGCGLIVSSLCGQLSMII